MPGPTIHLRSTTRPEVSTAYEFTGERAPVRLLVWTECGIKTYASQVDNENATCAKCNRVVDERAATATQGALAKANFEADNARLRQEITETDQLNGRLASLLHQTANALKGDPGPLKLHSWHDLPEIAAKLRRGAEYAWTADCTTTDPTPEPLDAAGVNGDPGDPPDAAVQSIAEGLYRAAGGFPASSAVGFDWAAWRDSWTTASILVDFVRGTKQLPGVFLASASTD